MSAIHEGSQVVFVDEHGNEHEAEVTKIWSESMVNLKYVMDGKPETANSVPLKMGAPGRYFFTKRCRECRQEIP